MPRSKRARAYAEFWFNLVELMRTSNGPYNFNLPTCALALDKRNEFYSFLRALENEAHLARKRGEVGEAQRYQALFNAGRSWEASIRPTADVAVPGPRTLVFLPKSARPEMMDMQRQLDQQASDIPGAPSGMDSEIGMSDFLDSFLSPEGDKEH